MCELDLQCPGYHWADNKGYGTAVHMEALKRLGPTIHHRISFAPVAEMKLLFAS
jgi:ribonuclease HII